MFILVDFCFFELFVILLGAVNHCRLKKCVDLSTISNLYSCANLLRAIFLTLVLEDDILILKTAYKALIGLFFLTREKAVTEDNTRPTVSLIRDLGSVSVNNSFIKE